jgi:hypothetical protein
MAETAAGDTGIVTQVGKKRRQDHRTVATTDEGYAILMRYAEKLRTDLKSALTQLILSHKDDPGENDGLKRLKAEIYRLALLSLNLLMQEYKAGRREVSVADFERLVRSIQKLESIPEKSSPSEHAPPIWLKEVCYDPEIVKKALEQRNSPGDRDKT